jgi:hypothetical protein
MADSRRGIDRAVDLHGQAVVKFVAVTDQRSSVRFMRIAEQDRPCHVESLNCSRGCESAGGDVFLPRDRFTIPEEPAGHRLRGLRSEPDDRIRSLFH